MIVVNLGLTNPFSRRFDNLFNRSALISKNKAVEFEIVKNNSILSIDFRLSTRCDHAGASLEIGLLGYGCMLQYYDTRHWNYKQEQYYVYSEELK